MPATNSTITTTGATTVGLTNTPATTTLGQLEISGTYAGLVFKIQGSFDNTNFFDIALQRLDTGASATGNVTPGTNVVIAYQFNCANIPYLQFNATTPPVSGTVSVTITTSAFVGAPPIVQTASFSGVTFTTTTLAGTTTVSGPLQATSPTGGIGYAAGAGGAVTQATNRTTGVTLNTVTGAITLVSAAGSAAPASFTVTNSAVAATDTIVVSQKSGTDLYEIFVTAVAAGSFKITSFTTGGTTTEQPVFNFAVVKGAAS